jgi:hypothetical protein
MLDFILIHVNIDQQDKNLIDNMQKYDNQQNIGQEHGGILISIIIRRYNLCQKHFDKLAQTAF